jgi:hypothetical protein
MERLRRRPSSCSKEGEGWVVPVLLSLLVQRVDEGLERRVAFSPSPQHFSLVVYFITNLVKIYLPIVAHFLACS